MRDEECNGGLKGGRNLLLVSLVIATVLGSYALGYFTWTLPYTTIPLTEMITVDLGSHPGATWIHPIQLGSYGDPETHVWVQKEVDVYLFVPVEALEELEDYFWSLKVDIHVGYSTRILTLVEEGVHAGTEVDPNTGLEGLWTQVHVSVNQPVWFKVHDIITRTVEAPSGVRDFPIYVYSLQSEGGLYWDAAAIWHLDIGEGSTAYDSTLNGNHGTIYGASWVEGRYGYALSLDGVDDYVVVPDDPSLNVGTDDFTVSLWIKTTQATGIIVEKYNGTRGWQVYLYNGRVNVWGKDPSGSFSGSSTSTYNDGVWHHVVVVFDKDSGICFYKDGDPDGISTSIVARQGSLSTAKELRIGRQQSGAYYNGLIDEVQIYNKALTPEEISELYEEGPP
ncbi:LamG domain-containing protein [Candidatus Bathyarchaeota archaeon]|nr:LamG domain-containing protein [Candidatus Bathyarchaeota archaeon]